MSGSGRSRGQLVLVAAVVVAVALLPVVLAYLQLGYHADVRASADYDDPTEDAVGALTRSLHRAASAVPANYGWRDRGAAAQRVRDRLKPTVRRVEHGRIDAGTARHVSFNGTEARRWAASSCPGGPSREFGACEAIDGVVVQDRTGRTHVLGIVVDITVTTDRGRTETTVRVPTAAMR